MRIEKPRRSRGAGRSLRSGGMLRDRAVLGATLLAMLLAGCDSGPVAPAPAEPQRQHLAVVRLDFDLIEQSVSTTVFSVHEARLFGPALQLPAGPRFSLVNDLLQAGTVTCIGCENGTLGWHQVSVPLTNISSFVITNLSVQGSCTGCQAALASTPPASLGPSCQYTQSVAVDVTQPTFTVTFNVFGDLALPPPTCA
jgi:hypothetical protein